MKDQGGPVFSTEEPIFFVNFIKFFSRKTFFSPNRELYFSRTQKKTRLADTDLSIPVGKWSPVPL